MNGDIINRNSKYQYHGNQVWTFGNEKILLRCKFKNGILIGYSEHRMKKQTRYYIK